MMHIDEFTDYALQLGCSVLKDEPLKNHCTFKVGGPVQTLVIPRTKEALRLVLIKAALLDIPFHILGNGSNVLVPDEGLPGAVIKLYGGLTQLDYLGGNRIYCEAGVALSKLCLFALQNSLTGLEFAYGIPGSVGGAVYMNAGAYGGEIKDLLYSAEYLNSSYEFEERQADELDMSYRNTVFMRGGRIVTSAVFSLSAGDKTEIEEKMNTLLAKRKSSQPLEYPSAGSTFKRPAGGYAAALIEEAGLKGTAKIGGAMVSEKHAGFVINTGDATSADILLLIKLIQDEVYKNSGIMLTPEVEILGSRN